MQPYFIPYLGHFSLINVVDEWIFFDLSQHKPKSWMTRNRLLHPQGGCTYSSVPLINNSISIPVKDVIIKNVDDFRTSLLGKLSAYRRMNAPYYYNTVSIVESAFYILSTEKLVDLNVAFIKAVCNYLYIDFNYCLSSELSLNYDEIQGPGDWALVIAKTVGADTYINPISGEGLFNKEKYNQSGVDIKFLKFEPFVYDQFGREFIENLSILDVLMWNDKQTVINYLNEPDFNVVV